MAETDLSNRQRCLGGGGKAVSAHRHRRGPGMRRLAGEDADVALDAAGSQHGGRGLAAALQHRSLLDVQLEVGARAPQPGARLARALELYAVARDDVLEALAVAVAQVPDLAHVERAGTGRGAEQAAPEARALLVGPIDQPQPYRRLPAGGLGAQRLDGGEYSERAVEPTSGRHRVHV